MEGASAAITFIQLGLSIATTLNTYIADVRHGRDDVANLANEIEATVSHAQELDKLIQENKLTARWSDHGRFLAEKCLTDCHDVIKRLSSLLRRSGGTASGMPVLNSTDEVELNDTKSLISRTDIDMSNFNRLYWPLLKPQLQYLKQELQKIKIEILLAVNTYQVNATPETEERKAIAERIVALWRSRTVARRQLVVCRREVETSYDDYYGTYRTSSRTPRDRYDTRARERGIPDPDPDSYERPRGRARDASPAYSDRSHRRYARRPRSPEILRDETPPRDFRAERDPVSYERTAYPQWERNGLPFAPDPEYVGEKSKGRQIVDYALGFVLGPGEDKTGARQNLNHLWDSYKHNPAALRSVLSKLVTAVPPKPTSTLPLALRDAESPNGTAFTWSLLISNRVPEYAVEPVNYPLELLSKRLLREERKSKKSGSLNLQAYNTLSTLPKPYQNMITRWLQPMDFSPFYWELLILDPTYGPTQGDNSRRQRLTQKLRRATGSPRGPVEPTSVLAVFKRCMRPDNAASSLRSRSRSSDSERRARRKRTIQNLVTAAAGAIGAAQARRDRRLSSSRSPRGRQRRRRSFTPRSPSRARRYADNQWKPQPRQEPESGRVYEMFDTEEPPDADNVPDQDLADRIMTEYTGHAARPNATNASRPNGVASENISDAPTANGDTLF